MKRLPIIIILCFCANFVFAQINKQNIDAALVLKGIDVKTNGCIITSQYTSKNNGVTHVYLRQTLNNMEVFNANSSLHFDKTNHLIAFNNSFVTNTTNTIIDSKNAISYSEAITVVATQLGKTT